MKMKNELQKNIVSELPPGENFVYFSKTDKRYHVMLKTKTVSKSEFKYNSVELETGDLYKIDDSEPVFAIQAVTNFYDLGIEEE